MSSESSTATQSGGIGFVGLLTILFIALKLTGVIAWSWWWVLSPVLISTAVVAIVLFSVLCVVAAKEWRR